MDNVIQFPEKTVRDKALIEKAIENMLDQTPADEETKEKLTKRLLEIWKIYQHEFPASFGILLPETLTGEEKQKILNSIQKCFVGLEKSLQKHIEVLLFERMQTEIKLYLLESRR